MSGNRKKAIAKEEHKNYRLLATGFGVGKVGHMPGTLGSLLALPIWLYITNIFRVYFVPPQFIYIFWGIIFLFLFFFGALTARYMSQKTHRKDPPSVIIDEVLGQLITLVLTQHLIINYINNSITMNLSVYGTYFLLNLVFFRLLDIFKPSILGMIDKKIKGNYKIMLDDVIAGIITAILINILYFIF